MSVKGFLKKIYRILQESEYIPKKFIREILHLSVDSKKVLLISHELTFSGAPIVLLNIANILRENGFEVVVISYAGGGLERRFKELGIPVFISSAFKWDKQGLVEIAKTFDFVIANTVVTYESVWYIKDYVKYIWLVHESMNFETDLLKWFNVPYRNCPSISEVLRGIDEIYTVSEYSKKVFDKYVDNVKVIHNGIPDFEEKLEHNRRDGKVVFSFIGAVNERKAPDIFVEAVELLPESYRKRAVFNLVGELKSDFAKNLRKKSHKYVNWFGCIKDKSEINRIYDDTDLLVVVSRDDTAPLVVAEAASRGVPSVISRNVGSTYLIEDGVSGFIIPTGDVEALKDIFIKVIDSPEILDEMRDNVRKKYLETSTLEIFEKNFMHIVSEKLNSAEDVNEK